ncbi:helix-turn-helix domain-containing protein [Pseudonocardia sp.]|uniref:helix-turn-helix transcriptional regulator n=1 Tax=Pseudonocardia sp. TaxID=60912 RepID=UPI0026046E01|nr:helix-turn-helix domain-containing protein [Pseudonocardia sp.]
MCSNDAAARHRTHGALAVPSRVRLLDRLRAADVPLTAQELAVQCGLHVTTVRSHLDVLAGAGLVHARAEAAGRRGRPRMLYHPSTAGEPPAGYELLAGFLAAHWADDPAERAQRAERAGRAAAAAHPVRTGEQPVLSLEESLARISGVFAELGFEPDVVPGADATQIRLHHCPFRAVATEHPEVVCSLHLGLLRGLLDGAGPSAEVTGLAPFVEPHLCIAYVAEAPRA